jgi:hypothetical protein
LSAFDSHVKHQAGESIETESGFKTVPRGHFFLTGDNPDVSIDSRSFGAVPISLMEGRVFAKAWKMSRGGLFSTDLCSHVFLRRCIRFARLAGFHEANHDLFFVVNVCIYWGLVYVTRVMTQLCFSTVFLTSTFGICTQLMALSIE